MAESNLSISAENFANHLVCHTAASKLHRQVAAQPKISLCVLFLSMHPFYLSSSAHHLSHISR